jgi:hypothetical protein
LCSENGDSSLTPENLPEGRWQEAYCIFFPAKIIAPGKKSGKKGNLPRFSKNAFFQVLLHQDGPHIVFIVKISWT